MQKCINKVLEVILEQFLELILIHFLLKAPKLSTKQAKNEGIIWFLLKSFIYIYYECISLSWKAG